MTQWGIETLFNPSKRHADEEKRRLQATREVVGDSSKGRRIDLESGTVRISRPKRAEATGEAEADDVAETDRPETDQAEVDRPEVDRPEVD
ncbi:MAG: hypothetical protein JWM76_3540 [Pseudonocardiales bacterium]|nr:hypothetical protein [Pseudonocardiales bacterium]